MSGHGACQTTSRETGRQGLKRLQTVVCVRGGRYDEHRLRERNARGLHRLDHLERLLEAKLHPSNCKLDPSKCTMHDKKVGPRRAGGKAGGLAVGGRGGG